MPGQNVIEGTLELLIRRTLLFGPLHGHGIIRPASAPKRWRINVSPGQRDELIH